MGNWFGLKLLFRILLISAFLTGSVFLLVNGYSFSGFFCLLVVSVLLIEFYQFLIKPFRDVNKTISAMFNGDFSLKSPARENNELFDNLSKLYEKQKESHFEQQSFKIIYDNILNSISTGILILRKMENDDWNIFLMNESFAKTFQIPIYSSWRNFERNVPEFSSKLYQTEFKEIEQTLEISIDNQENQTYSIKTSKIKTYNYSYFIVSLDSVQSIVEKKEKQAWYDLMKVISHEMMNTLTPINSLVNSLQYYSEQEIWNEDDRTDFRESLQTIQKKTVHMLEFVDNYRELTNFPRPKKVDANLVSILDSCVEMMKPMFEKNQIEIKKEYEKTEFITSVDTVLIERVIINLLTNSIYALQNKQDVKQISLKIYDQNHRILIEIQDNGIGIEREIRDKVFIPFFTTRENGAGIGLSLSKNIMEAHGGHLTFKSKSGETVFLMSFSI